MRMRRGRRPAGQGQPPFLTLVEQADGDTVPDAARVGGRVSGSDGELAPARRSPSLVAVLRGFRAGRVLDGDDADVAIGCFRKRVAEDLRTPDAVLVGLGLFFRIVGVGQTERQAGSDRKCQSDVDRKCQSDGESFG